MSVSAVSDDSVLFSRLQLAKALKEDPSNIHADPPENSAIFLRQRNRNTNSGVRQHSRDNFLFPRPMNLLVPPVLGGNEEHNEKNDNSPQPNQASQQVRRPSQPQVFTSSPRNSLIIPEERRGSTSKTPTTLLDVRQSMLENRQNLHNSIPFSTSSSHRTSVLLQQHKTLPDANGKPHGSSKLGNTHQSSSRPTSTYIINNNVNSRPTSFYKSNKSSNPQDSDNEEEGEYESLSSINSSKSKSQKSREIKKASSSSSDDSDSPPKLPPIKSVTSQSITLEKVEEEDNSSDESEESEQDDDDDSSEDDTPLALKTTPKIKVAPPPRITTRKNSGGRIEAWLEHVSGSPEGPSSRSSTPSHSPTHIHSPRVRRTSEHSIHHHSSSPLGMSPGHRTSLMVEPIHDARNRRPRSAFVPDKHVPIPDLYQPRKRSNSEFVPRRRTSSIVHEPPPQVPSKVPSIPYGRVSPSPRQDSGYWAKDTLVALSDDFRHVSLMNDINSPPKSKGSNLSSNAPKIPPTNNEVAKLINRHRREGSGSSSHNSRSSTPHSSRPSTPQSHNYVPVSPLNGNRNHLHTNNSNIHGRISSEQLVTSNRSSVLYPHQQKHRIRS